MMRRAVPVGTRTQLLVDDYLIAASEGVATTLHPMSKLPEPVLQAAAPWERPETGGLWGIPNAIYDPEDGLFKLWYHSLGTYPARNQQREPAYSCYATVERWAELGAAGVGGCSRMKAPRRTTSWGVNGTASPNGGVLDSLEMVGLEPAERRFKTCGSVGRDDSGQGGPWGELLGGRHPLGAV